MSPESREGDCLLGFCYTQGRIEIRFLLEVSQKFPLLSCRLEIRLEIWLSFSVREVIKCKFFFSVLGIELRSHAGHVLYPEPIQGSAMMSLLLVIKFPVQQLSSNII